MIWTRLLAILIRGAPACHNTNASSASLLIPSVSVVASPDPTE
jgi:hypothetical protein